MREEPRHNGIKHVLTIYYQHKVVSTVDLGEYGKNIITLGRARDNDIVINSPIVSFHHAIIYIEGSRCTIKDDNSKNGIVINGSKESSFELKNMDNIRIDNMQTPHQQGILMVYSRIRGDRDEKWTNFFTAGKDRITIGRDEENHIVLNHNSISRQHALITKRNDSYYLEDLKSTNGTFLNGNRVTSKVPLKDNDVIFIGNTKMVFHSDRIFYDVISGGLRIDAINIKKTIKERKGLLRRQKTLLNDISISIRSGELVALVGGSGAGKSTFLDALNGFRRATSGTVLVNDDDFYENYGLYKNILGYVPQQDIVYDILSVRDMLSYAAELRMPKDTTRAEIKSRISQVIKDVELEGREDVLIKNLSGGQRKRVSIAVELLADPKLFFLDEPTSGLDPGMERNMMRLLKKLSSAGKTIILITHATANLNLCDKVVFLGKGGRLCYFGPSEGALEFFKVDDFADIYNLITDEAEKWEEEFKSSNYYIYHKSLENKTPRVKSHKVIGVSRSWSQFLILSRRYLRLTLADRQRFMFLLVQSPLIAILLGIVTKKNSFEVFESSKQIIFTLSCSAVWIGMLNSIQEICKERVVFNRERSVNLNLLPYIFSKLLILGLICIVQAFMLIYVFDMVIPLPAGYDLMGSLKMELVMSAFFTLFASTAMGLAISALVTNTDRAMGLAPILLIPQIMFSGFIFKMQGFSEKLSYVAVSKWSARALAVSLKINDLPLKIIEDNKDNTQIVQALNQIEREIEHIYDHDVVKLYENWGVLLIITVICILLSLVFLNRSSDRH